MVCEAPTPSAPPGAGLVRTGWLLVTFGCLKVLAITSCYVSIGALVDVGRIEYGPLFTLLVSALVAVAAAAGAGIGPTAAGRQERAWRAAAHQAVLQTPGASPTGDTVHLLTAGAEATAAYRAGFLPGATMSLASPAIVLCVLGGWVSWSIAGYLALAVLLIAAVIRVSLRLVRRASGAHRRILAGVAGSFYTVLSALGTLRLYGATDRSRADLARSSRQLASAMTDALKRNQLMIIVVDLAASVGLLTCASALALQGFSAGDLTAGGVLTIVLLTTLLYDGLDQIGRTLYLAASGRTQQARLRDLLAVTATASSDAHSAGNASPAAIELRGVGARHGNQQVLTDISATIPPGALVAVAGPSGAGKTTLATLLQGLKTPCCGQLLLDGSPVQAAELTAVTATLRQHPYLFSGTVADNLQLADPAADPAAMWAALQRAHLADDIAALPQQLQTQVGEDGLALSGGQLRRLALARALLARPRLLILDEPTADVDRRTEALIGQSLAELRGQTTVLLIAHRLQTTQAADSVLVLDGGHLVAAGTPAQLLTDPSGYYATAMTAEQTSWQAR